MIGAIIGDYVGSYYEDVALQGTPIKGFDLPMSGPRHTVTDDSVMLAATVDSVLNGESFANNYRRWYARYPNSGFSDRFIEWMSQTTNNVVNGDSYGNGAAVRTGVLGYLKDEVNVIEMAEKSAICTHSHPEGVSGAKAMAWTVWALRNGLSVKYITKRLYDEFDYYIDYDQAKLHEEMTFDSSALNTVPVAIWAALNTQDFLNCMRMCLYIGGDVDTIAAMAGMLSQQRFPVDDFLLFTVKEYLHTEARPLANMLYQFEDAIADTNYLSLNAIQV